MAANTVFSTYELVLLIAPSLDELSLVRVQRVNHTFRAVIKQTSRLQIKLGVTTNSSTVLDVKALGGPQNPPSIWWNPILEWFCIQSFIRKKCSLNDQGPLKRRPGDTSGDSIILLPHALRAARNANCSIHSILITMRPVSKVCIRFLVKYDEPFTCQTFIVRNPRGVTIGDVFKEWSNNADHRAFGAPVQVWLPWRATFAGPARALDATLNDMVRIARFTSFRSYLNKIYFGRYKNWSSKHTKLVQKWYKHTVGVTAGTKWFNSTFTEQNAFVEGFLKEQKAMVKRTHDSRVWDSSWPALALGHRKNAKVAVNYPYEEEVAFACGMVFNRQD